MIDTPKEDEMSTPPKPDSPAPEIFSKKIFFLNSSYSDSRRSEIPHIESDYYPRDEVSRRLFHRDGSSCDWDCSSEGCWSCLTRNKNCFFKFFALSLSIVMVLLLFGSLSYKLTRKAANESSEFEKTVWVSHYHEYTTLEENVLAEADASLQPVLDFPVPVYEHSEDYDSREDLRKVRHHSTEDSNALLDHVEPFIFHPLSTQKSNFQDTVFFIHDGRDPIKSKRSISTGRETMRGHFLSEGGESRYELPVFEKLNAVEEGMEKFWAIYFKKGNTVFEPFSLTTPLHSTPMKSYERFPEEYTGLPLNEFSRRQGDTENSATMKTSIKETAPEGKTEAIKKITQSFEEATSERVIEVEGSYIVADEAVVFPTSSKMSTTSDFEYLISDKEVTDGFERHVKSEFTFDDASITTENVRWDVAEKSPLEGVNPSKERFQKDPSIKIQFPTWPIYHFPPSLPGILGFNQVDQISAQPAPLDGVKGISLAEAKKIKKERRKQTLLNSRVVGGSSDVRLPTGPDISKQFVNAFETLKTNQQLSFTPSASSQFILPYQMCLFGGPFPGSRQPVQAAQPRTFSFETPHFIPSIFNRGPPAKTPYQMPAQQNILSFSINNYPNGPPSRQPIQPSGGSAFNLPTPQLFSQSPGPSKQPIFCTYLQPPLFQFPTVPGTADFSHAKSVDCRDDSQTHSPLVQDFLFSSGKETLCSDDKVSCMDDSDCIPAGNWCDNRVHCKDASDEAYCSCRERVSRDRLCDGYIDCPHGEDENGCYDCPKSAFSCGSVISPGSCISLTKRCDGVVDCSNGSDEADCSALFFHVRHNDSYDVPQVAGYLHRNWKGSWFPVCVEIGENLWAEEACRGELGVVPSVVEVKFASVSTLYKGPFIIHEEDGTVSLQDHCKGHIMTFVKCPAMTCGTRLEHFGLRDIESHDLSKDLLRSAPKHFERETIEKEKEKKLKREETGRVVGGRESEPKAWPWAIAVYKNGAFHCGGVILDEKWILTAAHCMEQYWKHYYEVRGGMLRRFSFSAMEQVRAVSHVIIHENYDLTIMSNDVALLRLQEPFHFNRWVRPACLPALQEGVSKFLSGPAPGTRCTAIGWGAMRERGTDPDQLREVEIPIMVRCKHKEDLVGEEICAGKLEGGKDTCQGDSGGPLLCRDTGNPEAWYVAGIVSHGEGCARPGEPGAYTRISLFVDWITSNSNDFRLPSSRPRQNCPGFRCRSASKLCIPLKWVCNGYTDCLEAEDERSCTSDPKSGSGFFDSQYSAQYKYIEPEDSEHSVYREKSSTEETLTSDFLFNTLGQTEKEKNEVEIESIKREEELNQFFENDGMKKIFHTQKAEGTITFSETAFVKYTKSANGTTPITRIETQTENLFVEPLEGLKNLEMGTSQQSELSTDRIGTKEEDPALKDEKKYYETLWSENDNSHDDQNYKDEERAVKVKTMSETEREEERNEAKNEEGSLFILSNNYDEAKVTIVTTVPEAQDENEGLRESVKEKGDSEKHGQEVKLEEGTTDEDIENEGRKDAITGTEGKTSESQEDLKDKGDEETSISSTTASSSNFWENSATEFLTSDTADEIKKFPNGKAKEKDFTDTTAKDPTVKETELEPDFGESTVISYRYSDIREVRLETEPVIIPGELSTVIDTPGPESEDIETAATTPLQRFTRTLESVETPSFSMEYPTFSFDSKTTVYPVVSGTDTSKRNPENDTHVESEYFQCRQIVQSILLNYRCDGLEDCEDGSDEEDCFCGQALFHSNPQVICNGRKDCPDGSDEKNCSSCLENEFFCKKSGNCISLRHQCDGETNCKFGEDERNCLTLTGSKEMRLQNNGETLLSTEGFLMINRNGVWELKCQEEIPVFAGGEAIQVCSALGTIGYEMYENRSIAKNCTGFHVTCAKNLVTSVDRYKIREGTYRWPWNAFVYSDGVPTCSAVLLRPRWLLTSSRCLRGISFKMNYVVAKLGGANWTTNPNEEGVKIIRVDGARVIPDSDVGLLHLSKEVSQSEYIRLLGIPYAFDSDPKKDLCVVVGDRTVFLKPSEGCPEDSRCFNRIGLMASDCKSKPYIGVVVCQSRFGWYPASVFSEALGHCGFKHSNYTSLQEKLKPLRHALDMALDVFPEPDCRGFRCSLGLCIRQNQLCDKYADCSSAEDENFEFCKSNRGIKECKITELKCRNGRCIPKVLFGDGKNDCGDESDEPRNKTCAEYLLLTSPNSICDGRRNCYDKTDEDYKSCPCDSHKFRCKLSDYCIPKDFVCDGERDCPSGEDEEQCTGRRIMESHDKFHLEVMQRSYGIWHNECSVRMSKKDSDALCKELGFKKALSAFDRNQTVIAPNVDAFSWVKLNQNTRIALRRSKPFVKLITVNRTCSYVKCA